MTNTDKPKGLFASLTPDQQSKALSYAGPDSFGRLQKTTMTPAEAVVFEVLADALADPAMSQDDMARLIVARLREEGHAND